MALIIYDEVAEMTPQMWGISERRGRKERKKEMKRYKVYEFIGTPRCGSFDYITTVSAHNELEAVNAVRLGNPSGNYVTEEIVGTSYTQDHNLYLNAHDLNTVTLVLIETGHKTMAIKLRRAATNESLKSAKDFVDNFVCE